MAGGGAMAECDRTLARIEDGIRLLSEHENAFAAFRLMNRAMHQQRIRTIFVAGKKAAGDGEIETLEEIDEPKNRSWRPFQLAFILALTHLDHPDRSADPTAAANLL